MATLAYRDTLRKQTQMRTNIKKQSVLIPTDHITGDSAGDFISEVYLRTRSLVFSIVLLCMLLILWACIGVL